MQELHEHKKIIRKNALWLFWGQLIGRLLRTAIIIYPARILPQESWGAFNYALSIATFLTVFSDIGLNALLTREASKNPDNNLGRKEYISTAFFIKSIMLLALALGFIFIANLFLDDGEVKMLAPFMILIFMFDSLRDLGSAIARASEKMEKEGINNILTNFFIAGLGFLFLYYSKTTISIAVAYALGTGLGLLSIAIALKDDVKRIFSHFNRKLVGHIITSAWPFGLVGLMGTIMLNTDIFIIGWLMSLKDVALYSAPQKIIQLLYIGPVLISAAFFPAFAKHVKDTAKFKDFFETGISLISMFAIPIALGAFMLAGPIIDLIYGSGFETSVLSFKILSFTIVIFSFLVLIGNAIFAHDKPRVYITYAILGVVGNLAFDFLFIPIWGIAGSAMATLLNQIIISVYAWREMRKISQFSVLTKMGKIFLASIFMGGSVFVLDMLGVAVILNILTSASLYFAILFALKEEAFYQLLGRTSVKA